MTNSRMNPKVDEFLNAAKEWKEEYEKLRNIVLDCDLTEEFKWMHPCYTFEKKNIVLIHGFKEYCAFLFHKGALLQDAHGILIQQTENVQAARQVRFTNVQEIVEMESILKAYIYEAIEVEKSGLEVKKKEHKEFIIPEELQNKFDEMPTFKTAFESLTPGRQRAYIFYFSQPKQSKTRESRIEKYIQKILDGKGLNDCTCGLSQKQPNCDGSHKSLDKKKI
ncbi:YdeI/OmpD-associated family protein [Bacillus thuringiensis]